MATILVLKPTRETRVPPPAADRSAEIIFFPGVRYERWQSAETPAPAKKKRRSRVKRDRMSINV
jgi:hypothetical protein